MLISIGFVNVDVICNVNQLPTRGQRIMSDGIQRYLGGMSTNLACAATHLADPWTVDVELIANIGIDDDGRWAEEQLKAYGVGSSGLCRDRDIHTSRCIILVEPDGERTLISEPSELNASWIQRQLDRTWTSGARKVLHVDGFHAPLVEAGFLKARRSGWLTTLDVDELPTDALENTRFSHLLQSFDLIFINQRYAQLLTHKMNVTDIENHLAKIARETRTTLLLTLGANGAIVFEPDRDPVDIPAITVDAIDTTGAGDVFAGVFLACWINGETMIDATRYACVAGALATQGPGACGSLPSTADIKHHMV